MQIHGFPPLRKAFAFLPQWLRSNIGSLKGSSRGIPVAQESGQGCQSGGAVATHLASDDAEGGRYLALGPALDVERKEDGIGALLRGAHWDVWSGVERLDGIEQDAAQRTPPRVRGGGVLRHEAPCQRVSLEVGKIVEVREGAAQLVEQLGLLVAFHGHPHAC